MLNPWEQCPSVWSTESKFWVWVRGGLRKLWSRHPVKIAYINKHRKRIVNPKVANRKRFPECWGMTCEICKKEHAQADIEIDHIGESGKFTCLDDMKAYAEHLFMVDFSSLRALCKPCHKIVNHSQRTGLSFEEAKAAKKVIEIMKFPAKEILALLQENGYNGKYTIKERKELVQKIIKGE